MRHLPRYWVEFEDTQDKYERVHMVIYRSGNAALRAAVAEIRPGERALLYRFNHGHLYQWCAFSMKFIPVLDEDEQKSKLEALMWISGMSIAELARS